MEKKTSKPEADVKKLATELANDAKEVEEKAGAAVKKATASVKKTAEKASASAKKTTAKASASAKKTTAKATTAAKKATATVKKTAAKATAKVAETKVNVEIQDDFGNSKNVEDLKAEVLAKSNKKSLKKVDIYVKPSQNAVYYVADGTAGSINLF
ncbi:MAG: DUF6465 family protein [Lachnospiraceae bacterium]|nr:DUF6465 family protein [Lachnospiraceae bacterium]